MTTSPEVVEHRARKSAHDELVYDLETGIGWALGAVLVLFARPVVWLMFHDWNEQRQSWEKWRRR